MPRTNSSPSAGSTVVDKLKSYEGGTGQTTAAAALAALGGVPATSVNQPNGVAGLDANQKLLAAVLPTDNISVVSAQGATSVIKGSVSYYTITNYDAFTNYSLTAIAGTVTRSGALITYTAPSTPQAGGFILAGRAFNVTVGDYAPVTPVLAGTHSGGTGNNVVGTFTGSAFSMQGNSDTHLNTDWQIASDANFTSIVAQSLADATNKTTWSYLTLAKSTTYYVRARYRSSGSFVSAWSNTVTITTKANYYPNLEEAKITSGVDATLDDEFGYSVAIAGDGTRVFVGAYQDDPGGTGNAGNVYIFLRTGSTWAQETKLEASNKMTNAYFGWAVAADSTGTRVIIGAQRHVQGGNGEDGVAYVFRRSGTTWTQETILIAGNTIFDGHFGYSVSIDTSGTRCAVGSYGSGTNAGQLNIFVRAGTTWTREKLQYDPDNGTSPSFGYSVAIDSTGTRVAVGSLQAFGSAGAVFVFVRSLGDNSWSQEQKISATGGTTDDQLGSALALNQDGTMLAAGASRRNSQIGAVFIFTRSGSTWTQAQALTASDGVAQDFFGRSLAMDTVNKILVVGAYGTDVGQTNSGSYYVFSYVNSSWSQVGKITASDGSSASNQGARFGMSIDITDDGSRVIAGADLAKTGSSVVTGAAYVYTS